MRASAGSPRSSTWTDGAPKICYLEMTRNA
jgi:hypothetical protein